MFPKVTFEEDLELKRFVETPADQKPRFNWEETVEADALARPEVRITIDGHDRAFNLGEVARTIGTALTDLHLARHQEDIFNDQNRAFVAAVAGSVGDILVRQISEGRALKLSENDLYLLIEKALIENEAYDVARSLIFSRSHVRGDNERNGHDVAPEPVATRLIRRNRQVVPWNEAKIEVAVRKAFLALHADSEPAVDVARAVTRRVREAGHAFINIEDVQDLVQEELMRQGHFKVAENYILYRAQRARARDEELEEPQDDRQESMVVITEPDGTTDFWNGADLRKRIEYARIGLDIEKDADALERELRRAIFNEMKREDLNRTIILNAKTLMEKDSEYARFAGRILLTFIYEEVLGWDIERDGIHALKDAHKKVFKANLKRGVEIKRYNPEILTYDLNRLADALDPSADMDFDYLGIQTLYDRYLIIDKTGKRPRRLEAPQLFWMRVAMGLFMQEEDDREAKVIALYNLYKSRRFCSSTPTLFNAGTLHSQLSSCYLYKVDDNIESIMMRGIAENAFLSKWAGGLGGSWTSVRGTGSYIQGTNGESQGVIPFLKLHNDQLVAVNQGGKRRGSGCAYLESWHNDIYDFLELRQNTGDDRRRTHDMNTANWIPDLFMRRLEERNDPTKEHKGMWTLFRASEVPDLHDLYGRAFEEKYIEYEKLAEAGEIWGKQIRVVELWQKMLKMLFETGHPWITFKDPCNVRSPQDHTGVIHSSNLCTEITLNTGKDETAVCNLGSVILDNHLDANGRLDHEKLRDTVRIAVRALDNVIDINFYPTEAARNANMRHRPVGLGVMGLQNALFKRGVPFASDEAVEFNDEFMEAIAYYAYEASSDLADEKGTYQSYSGSKWDRGLLPMDTLDLLEEERGLPVEVPRGGKLDWDSLRARIQQQGMRNSNVLAIAPTATISNIMGTTPCIEPTYKNLFVKSNLSGDFVVVNPYLVRDLKNLGLWNDDLSSQIKYFDGELADIEGIPAEVRERYLTAFDVPFEYVIKAAARRQKWIDQAQSVNLWLKTTEMKTLSHMYRLAWRMGLKTTYYLRSLSASNIEKSTVTMKKPEPQKVYTEAEKTACSIEAMRNGEECEACQ
ncbi:MAG: ribonucleoside-diphosphate reductase subunit alpha [Opitutales bacterium]